MPWFQKFKKLGHRGKVCSIKELVVWRVIVNIGRLEFTVVILLLCFFLFSHSWLFLFLKLVVKIDIYYWLHQKNINFCLINCVISIHFLSFNLSFMLFSNIILFDTFQMSILWCSTFYQLILEPLSSSLPK